MKIGELAKKTGLAPSRIRFYERIGLLKTVDRRSNGYRTYPQDAYFILELITMAQKGGFSLDEIRTLLPTDLDHWEHDALIEALRQKVNDIEALERRLALSKSNIVRLIEEIDARPGDVDCAANARRVLTLLRDSDGASLATEGDEVRLLDQADRRQLVAATRKARPSRRQSLTDLRS